MPLYTVQSLYAVTLSQKVKGVDVDLRNKLLFNSFKIKFFESLLFFGAYLSPINLAEVFTFFCSWHPVVALPAPMLLLLQVPGLLSEHLGHKHAYLKFPVHALTWQHLSC